MQTMKVNVRAMCGKKKRCKLCRYSWRINKKGGLMRCRLCRYMWRTNEVRAVFCGVGCVGIYVGVIEL